jgi:hypothetical protein
MKTDNPKNSASQNDTPNPGEYIGDVVGEGELREQVQFLWVNSLEGARYRVHMPDEQVDAIMNLIAANRNRLLTKAERAELEMYRRERSISLEDYHEYGNAPVGSPERMAAYVSQLSLHNIKQGAEVLKEWREDYRNRLLDGLEGDGPEDKDVSYMETPAGINIGKDLAVAQNNGHNEANAKWRAAIRKWRGDV